MDYALIIYKPFINSHRSTPVEALHTILLGCCKYMLREFMEHRTPQQKKEIMARIRAFPTCAMTCRVSSNISYFKSFIGRDFKAIMQMALFVLKPYFTEPEEHCWFLLSKVSFYCDTFVVQ